MFWYDVRMKKKKKTLGCGGPEYYSDWQYVLGCCSFHLGMEGFWWRLIGPQFTPEEKNMWKKFPDTDAPVPMDFFFFFFFRTLAYDEKGKKKKTISGYHNEIHPLRVFDPLWVGTISFGNNSINLGSICALLTWSVLSLHPREILLYQTSQPCAMCICQLGLILNVSTSYNSNRLNK